MTTALGRLKRRPEFIRVASARRKWVSPGLILQAARHTAHDTAHPEDRSARVGFTVSKKVGQAVDRNRARRRLRAVVDRVMSDHAAPGHDYVIIARAATLKRPFAALVSDLETALKRLGAYRRNGDGEVTQARGVGAT